MKEALEIFSTESLLLEEILHVVVVYHFFLECIASGYWRLDHFNDLGELLTFSGFERCNYFLCHDL